MTGRAAGCLVLGHLEVVLPDGRPLPLGGPKQRELLALLLLHRGRPLSPGRIMAVADVYDALVSERVYKPAMSHNEAVSIITEESGKHFDPSVVAAFGEVAPQFAEIHRQFSLPL